MTIPHPIPLPWFFADIFTLGVSLYLLVVLVRRARHPAVAILEGAAFIFLYAGVFENFATWNGWYIYGRSLLMIGEVPLSVPLMEACVFITGLWLLDALRVPDFVKPFVLGWLGMLQDLSLDPVAVRQIFTADGVTSGRWTWLFPPDAANFYHIPVYNFPGWMLIMLYGSAFILLGRWWFRRSGEKPWVGYVYPLAAPVLALLAMVSPLSQFLLWLGPWFMKGNSVEWVMLGFHLSFPILLLAIFWRGRMKRAFQFPADVPVFLIPTLFHGFDIACAIIGGYGEVLGLVLLASFIETAFLCLIFWRSRIPPRTTLPSPMEP
jgi:hypothetical protein